MPELIGGHQFAIPDVNSLKTSNWSNALGGIGFGGLGQVFRVLFLNESSTFSAAAGVFVFAETDTAQLTAAGQTIATGMTPWVVQTATVTDQWAGILVSSARGQNLCIVQIAGPATVTAATGADFTVGNTFFVPANATAVKTSSIGTAAYPFRGAYGMMAPGLAVSASTAVLNITPSMFFPI